VKRLLTPTFQIQAITGIWFTLLLLIYIIKCHANMCDLDVFLRAGRRLLNSEPMYNLADGHFTFKYFPVNGLIFAMLSPLTYPIASMIWCTLIAFCGWFGMKICFRWAQEDVGFRLSPLTLFLTLLILANYFIQEFQLGQSNVIMFYAILRSIDAWRKQQELPTALWWVLAFVIKPYVLPFLPFFFWKRAYRTGFIALGTATVLFFVPVIFYGWEGFWGVIKGLGDTAGGSSASLAENEYNGSLFGMFTKMGIAPYKTVTICSALTALGIGGWLAISSWGKADPQSLAIETAVIMILTPLVSPQGWVYIYWCGVVGVVWIIARWQGLAAWEKGLASVIFAGMGLLNYEVLGKKLYHGVLISPIIPLLMVSFVVLLLHLKIKFKPKDLTSA